MLGHHHASLATVNIGRGIWLVLLHNIQNCHSFWIFFGSIRSKQIFRVIYVDAIYIQSRIPLASFGIVRPARSSMGIPPVGINTGHNENNDLFPDVLDPLTLSQEPFCQVKKAGRSQLLVPTVS